MFDALELVLLSLALPAIRGHEVAPLLFRSTGSWLAARLTDGADGAGGGGVWRAFPPDPFRIVDDPRCPGRSVVCPEPAVGFRGGKDPICDEPGRPLPP
jgi:hypothetical protein